VTSLLTESAVGSFVHRVENELKQQQLKTVEQSLFIDCIAKNLMLLPEQLSTLTHFNISPTLLSEVEIAFNEKPHGLRLL
jgi:hypothetical protein